MMLPIKYKENLFHRVKAFFRRLFKLDKKYDMQKELKEESNIKKDLKKQMEVISDKNDIIEKIKKNPNLVQTLSSKRLEQLEELYDEKLLEVNIKLNQLKQQVKNLKSTQ